MCQPKIDFLVDYVSVSRKKVKGKKVWESEGEYREVTEFDESKYDLTQPLISNIAK